MESRVLGVTGLIGEQTRFVMCQEEEEGVPLYTNLASDRLVKHVTACTLPDLVASYPSGY